MERNKTNRNLMLLLILAIITLVALVSTFAKYTGKVGEATDVAKIAKWHVTLNGDDSVFSHEFTTNLTAQDDEGNYIIAPGVGGEYEVILENDGDVTVKVDELTLAEVSGNAAVPLKFKAGTMQDYGTLAEASEALKTAATAADAVIEPNQNTAVGTISWIWPFEGNDTTDTALGTASYGDGSSERTSYGLKMEITASQVQPE